MLHLEDSLKDIDKQIRFKELRREQATNSRQYQLCDEITHDITVFKTHCYQEKLELRLLQHKEQQSRWEKRQKSTSLIKVHQPYILPFIALNQLDVLSSLFLNPSNKRAPQFYHTDQKMTLVMDFIT